MDNYLYFTNHFDHLLTFVVLRSWPKDLTERFDIRLQLVRSDVEQDVWGTSQKRQPVTNL